MQLTASPWRLLADREYKVITASGLNEASLLRRQPVIVNSDELLK